MINPLTKEVTEPNLVSHVLAAAANGLFLIFLATVLIDLFPLKVLTPAWQFGFNNRLIGSGIPALIGFCLLHVAVLLNPGNQLLKQRLMSVRQGAIIAAVGFFLLIPLQGFATWKFFRDGKATQASGMKAANRRFSPIKQAIVNSSSANDLQERLAKLNLGMRLNEEQKKQPLPELKKGLLSEVERVEIQTTDRLAGPTPAVIWAAIQSSSRVVLASLGYSLAFAAGAQMKGSANTLLEAVANALPKRDGARRRRSSSKVDFPQP